MGVMQMVKTGKKAKMPVRVEPMLCTLTSEVHNHPDYLYEIKWDGYRIISYVEKGKVRMDSRSGKNYTNKYPPVAKALKALKKNVILDGEMVVFDEEGHPDFNAIQLYNMHDTPIFYYVFDIIWMEGYNLKELPLTKRKAILKDLLKGNEVLRFSESFEDGEGLFAVMKEKGLEGIIGKQKDSEYIEGDRSSNWLKMRTVIQQEFVIGGWAESDKTRSFRSILFGAYRNGELRWVGRSGGGYKQKEMPAILEKLKAKEVKKSPFVNEVLDTKGAVIHWVKPVLVANFEFATWTDSGRIRKPATWKGFRYDKDSREVVLEAPAELKRTKRNTGKTKKPGNRVKKEGVNPQAKTRNKTNNRGK